jgi:hypothetical protein
VPIKITTILRTLSDILTRYFRNTELKRYRPVKLRGGVSFPRTDTLLKIRRRRKGGRRRRVREEEEEGGNVILRQCPWVYGFFNTVLAAN